MGLTAIVILLRTTGLWIAPLTRSDRLRVGMSIIPHPRAMPSAELVPTLQFPGSDHHDALQARPAVAATVRRLAALSAEAALPLGGENGADLLLGQLGVGPPP